MRRLFVPRFSWKDLFYEHALKTTAASFFFFEKMR